MERAGQQPHRLLPGALLDAALEVADGAHTQPRPLGQFLLREAGGGAVAPQEFCEVRPVAHRLAPSEITAPCMGPPGRFMLRAMIARGPGSGQGSCPQDFERNVQSCGWCVGNVWAVYVV